MWKDFVRTKVAARSSTVKQRTSLPTTTQQSNNPAHIHQLQVIPPSLPISLSLPSTIIIVIIIIIHIASPS